MQSLFFKISRPRFWIYLLGPYLVGIAAADSYTNLGQLLLFGLYFSLPANLLIYGVNDIFDYETDKHNAKKQTYEELVRPSQHRKLAIWIAILNLPVLLLLPFVPKETVLSLMLFIFFGVFYSAKPIRAKTKPLLDSLFNILYIFPGLVSYSLLTGQLPPLQLVIAATLWCMAMHAYSAVPDISADKKAHISTIATWLGAKGTLTACLVAYIGAAVLSLKWLGWFSVMAGAVYTIMIVISLTHPRDLFKIYTYFPLINLIVGMSLFLYVLLIAN